MAQVVWKDSNNTLIQGVGESHRLIEWKRILPNPLGREEYRERLDVQLVAEPTNPADKTAVMMFVKGQHLGYLPRHVAAALFSHVVNATANGDTVAVPGSIWAVQRSDGLKANVSVFMPDDLLIDVDTSYSEQPVLASRPVKAKMDGATKLRMWGLGLGLFTLIGSGAGFSIMVFGVVSLVVNVVALITTPPPKLLSLVSLAATLLGFLIGLIVGVVQILS